MLAWIGEAITFIVPSYVANTTPIFVRKLPVPSSPIDFRVTFRNRRLLGDNKTWRGLAFGTLAGIGTALLQSRGWQVGLIMGFGALLGDLVGSFLKRRLGLTPGQPSELLDQTPYVIVPTPLHGLLLGFPRSIGQSVSIVPLSIGVRRASRVLYFRLGIKEVPH